MQLLYATDELCRADRERGMSVIVNGSENGTGYWCGWLASFKAAEKLTWVWKASFAFFVILIGIAHIE